ncbi:MAG: tetratricopeptide repeat protein [Gammaproteobacteria bacterium]|nr:tetratricopeptide repeat protein [Gammaproteobacteria bacterium]
MDEFLTDREQAERLKKWWLENYKAIFVGVIIAILIIGGWRYWQNRVQARSIAAATLFAQMGSVLAVGNGAGALKIGNQLISGYHDTPYAAQAAMAMAQYDVAVNKPDDAMQMLNWVIQHGNDDGLKLLARLRLARVKLSVGDPQAALTALSSVQPGGFTALYDDVRGDAYVKLGQIDKARAAYQRAISAWTQDMGDKSLIQMKLDNLAPVPAARTTTGAPQK